MTTKQLNTLNKLVSSFLSDNDCSELVDLWKTSEVQSSVKKLFAEKKAKAAKDPDAPKRAKTAYMFYCDFARKEIKAEYPDMVTTDITKEIGRRWTEIKDDEDAVAEYRQLAAEDKERYNNEMASYQPSEEFVAAKNTRKKSSKTVDPSAPKRPKSAYMFFCADERESVKEDNPDIAPTDIIKELGARWAALKEDNPKRHSHYVNLANNDKERYNREKEENGEASEEKPKAKSTASKTPRVASAKKSEEKAVPESKSKTVKKTAEKVVEPSPKKATTKKPVSKKVVEEEDLEEEVPVARSKSVTKKSGKK